MASVPVDSQPVNMAKTRLILVLFLMVGLWGCKQESKEQRAKELMSEAGSLFAKSGTKLTEQWTNEYKTAFTVENRAKFPANRDSLRASADKIITILDESSGVDRMMAEKYEEASKLAGTDDERRGASLIADALRKDIEINNLLKAQMRLVSDEEIKDEKTLNDKFMQSWQRIHEKQRESGDLLSQGKRALGVK